MNFLGIPFKYKPINLAAENSNDLYGYTGLCFPSASIDL